MAKKRMVYNIIIAICAVVFLVSAGLIGWNLWEYKAGNDEYNEIIHEYVLEDPNDPLNRRLDWDALKQANPDTVGWIYLPDSKIDYPVVQGKDNEHYLTKTFAANDNKLGAIFMDHLNSVDMSDDNTIIYGHHMRDGSMFKGLVEFKKQEYLDSHPIAYYYRPGGIVYEMHIFAGYTVDKDDDYTMIVMGERKQELYDLFQKRSDVKTNVLLQVEDKIMTLSTCTYDYDDARYVVQGKLVDRTNRHLEVSKNKE